MRTIYKRIDELNAGALYLGYVGENERTRVTLDCASVFSKYPNSVPALIVRPPLGKAYPAVTSRSGNHVIWNITDSDLTKPGTGSFQITFTEDNVVVKSCIGSISIDESLVATGDIPEPIENWLTEANTALNAIPQSINAALQEAKESGDFDGPQGEQGPIGDPGIYYGANTPTDPNYMVWIDPSGSSIIDDTAGTGDTDKIWSANKTAGEIALISNALTQLDQKTPSVTASDDGKIMMVVNGAWSAVAIANAEGGSY